MYQETLTYNSVARCSNNHQIYISSRKLFFIKKGAIHANTLLLQPADNKSVNHTALVICRNEINEYIMQIADSEDSHAL
jgi:hypothetical protein